MTTGTLNFFDGRITLDPAKATIRGKRIAVQTMLEFLCGGDTEEDILSQHPSLDAEEIRTC